MRMAFCRFKMGGPWFIPTSSLHKVSREMSTGIEKHHIFAPLLDVEMSFRVAGARDCAPCQKVSET